MKDIGLDMCEKCTCRPMLFSNGYAEGSLNRGKVNLGWLGHFPLIPQAPIGWLPENGN